MLDIRLLAVPAGILLLLMIRIVVSLWPKSVQKKKPALPGHGYRLIYADKAESPRQAGVTYSKLLVDTYHNLQGKPDMVFARGRELIPVELKSGSIGSSPEPREGDLMQLTVYFLLLEAEYGIKPKEGRLIYRDAMFMVTNTKAQRKKLLYILEDMRAMLEEPDIPPKPHYKKCLHCACRGTVCEHTE